MYEKYSYNSHIIQSEFIVVTDCQLFTIDPTFQKVSQFLRKHSQGHLNDTAAPGLQATVPADSAADGDIVGLSASTTPRAVL